MNRAIAHALETERTIDITTIGRRSGKPRRIEIWFHNVDGKLYITGSPGRRGWYANLLAHPEFTFHLKQSIKADISARARPILEEVERRDVLAGILGKSGYYPELEVMVQGSPLVEVSLLSEKE